MHVEGIWGLEVKFKYGSVACMRLRGMAAFRVSHGLEPPQVARAAHMPLYVFV